MAEKRYHGPAIIWGGLFLFIICVAIGPTLVLAAWYWAGWVFSFAADTQILVKALKISGSACFVAALFMVPKRMVLDWKNRIKSDEVES